MQGYLGGKVSILEGNSVGHCEMKKVLMNMYVIVGSYRVRAV
jgi:hypothetical protein